MFNDISSTPLPKTLSQDIKEAFNTTLNLTNNFRDDCICKDDLIKSLLYTHPVCFGLLNFCTKQFLLDRDQIFLTMPYPMLHPPFSNKYIIHRDLIGCCISTMWIPMTSSFGQLGFIPFTSFRFVSEIARLAIKLDKTSKYSKTFLSKLRSSPDFAYNFNPYLLHTGLPNGTSNFRCAIVVRILTKPLKTEKTISSNNLYSNSTLFKGYDS